MPEPQPAPLPPQEPDYTWLILLVLAYLIFSGGIGGGGQSAPFVSPDPNVFVAFDDDAKAVLAFDQAHPGQADVISSLADDSVRTWVQKSQGGHWVNYGIRTPPPDPKMVDPWLIEAHKYWMEKAARRVPYMVAAGPKKRGYAGAIPDTQEAAKKALDGIAK